MGKKFRQSFFRFFSFLFLLFAAAFMFSCSQSVQENEAAEETSTLRYTADALYKSTLWTEALELDRLSANVKSVDGISSKLNLTPLIVLASLPPQSSSIFPSLGSFGSLDTSLISKSLRETLTAFSDAISKYKDADSFVAKDSLYSLALFYADFKRIFNDCFELDKIDEVKAEPAEVSEEKTEDEFEDEIVGQDKEVNAETIQDTDTNETKNDTIIEEKSYFSSFKIGQPFLDGIYYQVPLKFFSDKATLTLCVFCYEDSGSWKIDQVQISDWEIF